MSAALAVRPEADEQSAELLLRGLTPPCDCNTFSALTDGNATIVLDVQRCERPATWALLVAFDCGLHWRALACDEHHDTLVSGVEQISHQASMQTEPYRVESAERL